MEKIGTLHIIYTQKMLHECLNTETSEHVKVFVVGSIQIITLIVSNWDIFSVHDLVPLGLYPAPISHMIKYTKTRMHVPYSL